MILMFFSLTTSNFRDLKLSHVCFWESIHESDFFSRPVWIAEFSALWGPKWRKGGTSYFRGQMTLRLSWVNPITENTNNMPEISQESWSSPITTNPYSYVYRKCRHLKATDRKNFPSRNFPWFHVPLEGRCTFAGRPAASPARFALAVNNWSQQKRPKVE